MPFSVPYPAPPRPILPGAPSCIGVREYGRGRVVAALLLLLAVCAPGASAQLQDAPGAPPSTAPWHLLDPELDGVQGASVERAWAALRAAGVMPGRPVVVAVIDSGVDTAHVDLRDALWVNGAELPGTGLDEDGNGFIDDHRGWNFLGGADGRNVEHDTWEVTRLYVGCTGTGGALAVRDPAIDCAEVLTAYEAKRDEAEQIYATVQGIAGALEVVLPMLREALGTDSLTAEAVTAFRPFRPELQQARAFFLQLAENGLGPADVAEALEEFEGQLQFNLNPDFDPRPIVGDRYEDGVAPGYGNPDVMGPDASHGTHVAGIIGALRGNGIGIDGIAPVRLLPIRAVPRGDEHDKDVAQAIRYAVDQGAHIINMSFGKGYSPGRALVEDAVRYAEERGVLLVHAAGNEGVNLADTPSFPTRERLDGGRATLWLEVGASGPRTEELAATFSNYGAAEVDLFAPGVDILSTVPGGGIRAQQGTSMAAPVVSGVAALLMAHFPALSAHEVREILLETAQRHPGVTVPRPGDGVPVPFDTLSVTGGVVNAHAAVLRALEREAEPRDR